MAVWLREYDNDVCPRTGERIRGIDTCMVDGRKCVYLSRRCGGWLVVVLCRYKGARA